MSKTSNDRQDEINLFSAMVNADVTSGTFELDFAPKNKEGTGGKGGGGGGGSSSTATSTDAAGKGADTADSLKNLFSQAALQGDDSGTFSFKPSTQTSHRSGGGGGGSAGSGSARINPNLEAAAAALADPEVAPSPQPTTFTNMSLPRALTAIRKPEQRPPMHTQEVLLQTPLVFGPKLPPRVLKQVRDIVADHWKNAGPNRRTVDLPPEVRNLVGAIRAYGHGVAIFPDEVNNSNNKNDESVWTTGPTSYVSVFSPLWGDAILDNNNGTDQSDCLDNDDDDSLSVKDRPTSDEEDTPKTRQSFFGPTPKSSSAATPTTPATPVTLAGGETETSASGVNKVSERDLFSMWARGEDDAGSQDGMSAGSSGSMARPDKATNNNNFASDGSAGSINIQKSNSNDGRLDDGSSESNDDALVPMSDQELFSQWARGESPANNSSMAIRNSATGMMNESSRFDSMKENLFNSGTFMTSLQQQDGSDDDSVVGSELKKKVGVNEHLNAALASLEDEWPSSSNTAGVNAMVSEDSPEQITQIPLTKDGGRPLTNLELMNGCTPLFGVDDSPLPVEADLGIHETKDEQQRSNEQRRNQSIIENCCPQNIFGPISCPNPALSPDDNQSWNSRSSTSQRLPGLPSTISSAIGRLGPSPTPESEANNINTTTKNATSNNNISGNNNTNSSNPKTFERSPSVGSSKSNSHAIARSRPSSPTPGQGPKHPTGPNNTALSRVGRFDTRDRYGWWNVPSSDESWRGEGSDGQGCGSSSQQSDANESTDFDAPLQLPPLDHSASALHVQTNLEPSPETLHLQNRPLSHLHPATAIAQSLPFISDRPPSYRYLQVDTQAVGFPNLGGEVEPLFCSVAIYNVETVASPGNDPSLAPIPDLQRCGRVTETLHFDVVSDPVIEKRCFGSLWPYAIPIGEKKYSPIRMSRPESRNSMSPASIPDHERLQGTRCGVFPLASNLNISNLYAILIVHKVISEGTDFEAYLRPGKGTNNDNVPRQDKFDIELLRTRAEKASNRHGKFLMPFAFGVAPLLQVFGAEVPVMPSSRAVQIPLFRFSAGLGERQMIDHIMVMLYPRADHRASGISGPAAVTNGGTAMLIMRNFGYLGLHSVVHSRSSLARDRLVDFTCELQIRRREEDEQIEEELYPLSKESERGGARNLLVVPPWQTQFVAESTTCGGRNSFGLPTPANQRGDAHRGLSGSTDKSRSQLYAQELAPVPLQLSPTRPSVPTSPGLRAHRGRGSLSGEDIEPYYHTSFCNELLCHPRLLHNSPKGNIVIRVEMREMEWRQEYNSYFAYLPDAGPSIHNPRRGPFLVQGAFTSCSSRCQDPHFLDEFKLKLPLELTSRKRGEASRMLSLFFTVFKLSFNSKKKWGRRFRAGKWAGRKVDDIAGEMAGEANADIESGRSCRLVQLACGHLPLTSNSSLVSNGLYDVKMVYTARNPRRELCESGRIPPGTLIVAESTDLAKAALLENAGRFDTDDLYLEGDSESQGSGRIFGDSASVTSGTDSQSMNESIDDWRSKQMKQRSALDEIALQVRIVAHSSVHVQNGTLSEFFHQEPDLPGPIDVNDKSLQVVRLSRQDLLQRLASGASMQLSRTARYDVDKLTISAIDISKPSLCSVADISGHLLRIIMQLLKVMVAGTGEADLAWANPASVTPLRVHSFATLLQLLGSSSLHFSKRGVMQLDGHNKWNLICLSRVVALLFDEGKLFGMLAEEEVSDETFVFSNSERQTVNKVHSTPKERRRRHVRSNFEIGNKVAFPRSAENCETPQQDGLDDLVFGNSSSSSLHTKDDLGLKSRAPPHTVDLSSDKSSFDFSSIDSNGTKETASESSSDSRGESDHTNNKAKVDNIRIDSVSDFRYALEAGSGEVESDAPTSTGARSAIAMIKAFSGNMSGSRRWMTAPALATIREDSDGDDSEAVSGKVATDAPMTQKAEGPKDSLDTELVLRPSGSSVKQMRVPFRKKGESRDVNQLTPVREESIEPSSNSQGLSPSSSDFESSATDFADVFGKSLESNFDVKESTFESTKGKHRKTRSHCQPTSDEEIETAGTAFLDIIGKSLGVSRVGSTGFNAEERRVGYSHHKKTQSRCSIDWNIPEDDLTGALFNAAPEEIKKAHEETENEFDETMSSLNEEKKSCIKLPNFVDRLVSLGKSGDVRGRWFPFAYETIIMQWGAILFEQRASGESSGDSKSPTVFSDVDGSLADAGSRTSGVIVACAPVLFEIIKQSLGWRISNLFQKGRSKDLFKDFPPLVTLDDAILQRLEQLISMITDACLDSRNFDSWETRQTCIDVNDSIVRFLRDLFAFMDPACVYRLIFVYMSRFVVKDGRQWQDRDSSIGLRCSWEISKLQMNAITTFIRFPEFIKVNSPQMYNWGEKWTSAPAYSTTVFFDSILDRYQNLGLPSLVAGDSTTQKSIELPPMRPHWLSEIVIDICLIGTEHAEQNIQHRAASLLHELFWAQSVQGLRDGTSSVVASVYVTFVAKLLGRSSYLSSFSPKSQLRKDIIPCMIFVLQSAPSGLLRALWRKLCSKVTGKGAPERYGGVGYSVFAESSDDINYQEQRRLSRSVVELKQEPDIFDLFSLLNLALSTLEYEGSDDHTDIETASDSDGSSSIWRKEFLLALEYETTDVTRRRRLMAAYDRSMDGEGEQPGTEYRSSSSRKWHAHDGSLVVINTVQQIVRELRFMLEPSQEGQSFLNPARRKAQLALKHRYQSSLTSIESRDSKTLQNGAPSFSYGDTVVFVRAAGSIYLHSLTLRQSDIAIVKTLKASVELIKIFGIKIFNEAVGETLQHWMRVVSFHCGSRRAEVRVPASDFLELILRSTWDAFGSFFRIRLPLLAVQTEVMERIVATAAARHYRDQRRLGTSIDLFSNGSAEASLAPLWRTLDRLHHQSASQNVAFRSALIRLAQKLKKLFRAYIAAHALSFLNRSKSPGYPSPSGDSDSSERRNLEAETLVRANRISVHRVINASAGYSKQFLGFYSTALDQSTVAHHEAVEDAFLEAADVFSPTELPDHRVAWLRKLAEFHSSRMKYAEEATCHFDIYLTLKQASRLHGALWSSTPFLPWTDNMSDGIHLDGEGPAGDPDEYSSDFDDLPDINYGRQIDKTNSFRRIFYRVANSLRVNGSEWESGASKYLFYGVTLTSEYHTVSPWITLREMEANMLEEAEAAGNLFLKSGIVQSSRYAWSLAAQYYAEKFSYGKLAHVYERLARTVVSQVPPIDSSLQQEVCVSVPLGRFYRVWFHGGAPDELIGAEFVYRSASGLKLEQFGKELREVIRCIIPDKTRIQLELNGRPDESTEQNYSAFSRMGGASLEPVKIKVTPLRPLVDKAAWIRGLPEWFNCYIDTAFSGPATRSFQGNGSCSLRRGSTFPGDGPVGGSDSHPRDHGRSFSASVFSSASSIGAASASRRSGMTGVDRRRFDHEAVGQNGLVGADKFAFLQPINKDRSRGSRDWLKSSSGDFAEKSLRVTQLQVEQKFPACVARQAVVHRVVYTQSPLEAGVDTVCRWCTVLFRTAIATNGMAVLGTNNDPGIGNDAAKVVADCIHSSRIKEIGLSLLKKNTNVTEEDDAGDVLQSYDRLSEDEVRKLQLKLARSLVVFTELLHLLIARNRDLLLDVIQERKKGDTGTLQSYPRSLTRELSAGTANSEYTSRSYPAKKRAADNSSSHDARSRMDEAPPLSRAHLPPLRSMSAPSGDDARPRVEETVPRANHNLLRTISAGGDDCSLNSLSIFPVNEKVRTDSAIAVQSELQRAFISLSRALHPMILGIMGTSATPRWLKQCCQENYFSAYTYRQTKIPIGEELAFFPDDDMHLQSVTPDSNTGGGGSVVSKSNGSVDGATIGNGTIRSHGSRSQDSPGGSLGSGSAVSRGSEAIRSVKSSSHQNR